MKKENRVNEIINGFESFNKNEYRKAEFLPELLKLQNEIAKATFNENYEENLKLQDALNYLEKLNEEKNFIASKELNEFKKDSLEISNQIKAEISGNKGEELAFSQLERVHERHYMIKNLELKKDDMKTEIDAVVVSPKCIFIIEVKNTHRNIFIDENGDYYRTGKFNRWDSNIKAKLDLKEELLRDALSRLGLKEVKIERIVVFTNKRVEIQNRCKDLYTTFLTRLPYLIDQYIGKFIYTQGEMNEIAKVLEEARSNEAYPIDLDISKFKMDFANLMAVLEGFQDEEKVTVQRVSMTESVKSIKEGLTIAKAGLLELIFGFGTTPYIRKQTI